MELPGYDAWKTTDPRDAEPTEPPPGVCGAVAFGPCDWPDCDCLQRAEEEAAEMKREQRMERDL